MFKKMPVPLIAAAILLSILLAYKLYAPKPQNPGWMLQASNTQVVAKGQLIYAEHCASCHGQNREGQENWKARLPSGKLPAPPHDETGHTWHHDDEALFNVTKFGPQYVAGPKYQSDMPGFAGVLSDSDIVAVLSYIKAMWPADVRNTHTEINRRAMESKAR